MRALTLVHDWIVGLRGGERCLIAFLLLYPEAKVFSMFYKKNSSHQIIDNNFEKASVLNRLPFAYRLYKLLLPFYPLIGLKKLDTNIISLSHAAAKNIKKKNPEALHVCYCFTPMRYIWDQVAVYLGWKRLVAWPLVSVLRFWDKSCAKNVDHYVSISHFVSARIRRFYGRTATVVYPPVAKRWIDPAYATKPASVTSDEKYFLFASALVPYKGADIAIEVCRKLGVRLYVAGSGPELKKLKDQADDNIKFLGKVSDSELAYLFLNCRALIFPCKEDFGILPIEAQFAGKPVIALHAGACKETIQGYKPWTSFEEDKAYSGIFIPNAKNRSKLVENTTLAINSYLQHEASFSPSVCRGSAERFSAESFYDSWKAFLAANRLSDLQEMPSKAQFVDQFEILRIPDNKC